MLLWLEDARIERGQHLVGLTTGDLTCCRILFYFEHLPHSLGPL